MAHDVDSLRRQTILSGVAGFPFLLVYGVIWIAAAALTYVVPEVIAPWTYILLGAPAAPLAIALERRVRYAPPPDPDPLLPLTLQLLFVQIVAFPVALLVWNLAPHFLPVAFAAVVGAHFLPYQWVYRTRIYGVLSIVIAAGPYVLAVLFGKASMHYTGFLVGPILLAGAFAVRRHADATRQSASRP
jgi:hypothetical protein